MLIKPRQLRSGDKVATVSPSWGGPSAFPNRYETGKRQLEETFGVSVVEMPHTLASPEFLSLHPEARADDIMRAFGDPSISGIFATIGGDDSIRLIPYLDLEIIRQNPKVFIGFSDTTALHFACLTAGVSSFYGPSIMAGFAENGGIHRYTIDGVRRALFSADPIGQIPQNLDGWTAERVDWADLERQHVPRVLQKAALPTLVQGTGVAEGHLIGGCAEVLEMLKGTAWWPSLDMWRGAILFYETSEDAPSPQFIRYWLRNFAAQGILQVLNGILIARPDPKGISGYQEQVEGAFTDCLAEAGLPAVPVLSGLDFGHTQPMLTLPYGARARVDCTRLQVSILGGA